MSPIDTPRLLGTLDAIEVMARLRLAGPPIQSPMIGLDSNRLAEIAATAIAILVIRTSEPEPTPPPAASRPVAALAGAGRHHRTTYAALSDPDRAEKD